MSFEMKMNLLLGFIGFLLFVLGFLSGFLASHEDWFNLRKKEP